MRKNDRSVQIVFSDLAYKPGTTIIEESQKLALAVELAKIGFIIKIKDDQEVVDQIKLVFGDLFKYCSNRN